MQNISFRFADEKDCSLILNFICELADYENMLDQVVATEELLREWIFEKKKAEVIFPVVSGKEVGFALFFHNFSTFLGRSGIYLEDLYIKPEMRGLGYGKATLKSLLKLLWNADVAALSGGVSIGILRASGFIFLLAQSR